MTHEKTDLAQVKRILHDALAGLKEMHERDWVHLDIKFDNILIQYSTNEANEPEISSVKLTDTDNAVYYPGECAIATSGSGRRARTGTIFWRSPEGQVRINLNKRTDVWSFGLVSIYLVPRLAVIKVEKEERKDGKELDLQILERIFQYFGSVPLEHINDEEQYPEFIELSNNFVQTQGSDTILDVE